MEKEIKAFDEYYETSQFSKFRLKQESKIKYIYLKRGFIDGRKSRDEEIANLKAQIQRKDAALNENALLMQRLCGNVDNMKRALNETIDKTLQALSEEKEQPK